MRSLVRHGCARIRRGLPLVVLVLGCKMESSAEPSGESAPNTPSRTTANELPAASAPDSEAPLDDPNAPLGIAYNDMFNSLVSSF